MVMTNLEYQNLVYFFHNQSLSDIAPLYSPSLEQD